MRLPYRVRQFWNALFTHPTADELALAERILPGALMTLFMQMQPGEQAHSIHITQQLLEQGACDPNLLSAALLHDVGKIRHPLHIWERVLIVLTQKLLPQKARAWGQAEPCGWKRPFVVAEQHPVWGAELVAQAGASTEVALLIRRHQEPLLENTHALATRSEMDAKLRSIQLLDENN